MAQKSKKKTFSDSLRKALGIPNDLKSKHIDKQQEKIKRKKRRKKKKKK